MEENIIKLTEEELNSIRSIQETYSNAVYKLGKLQVEYVDFTQKIETEKNNIFNKLKELKTAENNLIDQLTKKYGDGLLDIKNGVYKPVKKQ